MPTGASASRSLVSCMRSTSGLARSSHHATFSRRARSELTFHVAIRMVHLFRGRESRARPPCERRAPMPASAAHVGPATQELLHIVPVDQGDVAPRRALEGG